MLNDDIHVITEQDIRRHMIHHYWEKYPNRDTYPMTWDDEEVFQNIYAEEISPAIHWHPGPVELHLRLRPVLRVIRGIERLKDMVIRGIEWD